MRIPLICFIGIALGIHSCLAISFDKDGNSIEPSSSVAFPAHYSSSKQELVGMAVRVKKILFVDFKVYAVGLYIDAKLAKSGLSNLKGIEPAAYTDESYAKIIDSSNVPKTLRLVMVRSVSGEQMGSAIGEAVESRLKAFALRASPTEREAIDKSFKEFRDQFNMPQLSEGAELFFSTKVGDILAITVGTSPTKSIESKALCAAFLDVFLGKDAVVNRLLLVSRLNTILE